MSEITFHQLGINLQFIFASIAFFCLLFFIAPYGKYFSNKWGVNLSKSHGWILMESPAIFLFALIFFSGRNSLQLTPIIFLCIWQIHYLNRGLIFPLRMPFSGKLMPFVIVAFGFIFNSLNAYINARWISHFGVYEISWVSEPKFLIGLLMIIAGFMGNFHSDRILRKLRKEHADEYRIPCGGLFRWFVAPNYLCEIIMWIGWAFATWSLAGLAFAIFTAANLIPRAWNYRSWYRKQFKNFPRDRKLLIPYVF